MIAVVLAFERLAGPVVREPVLVGEGLDLGLHLCQHFFFRNSADGRVVIVHRDDLQIVEFAENRELAELADAREEHEAEDAAQILERAEKLAHLVLERELEFRIFHRIQQRGVVFIDKHHRGSIRSIVGRLENIAESDTPFKLRHILDAQQFFECGHHIV